MTTITDQQIYLTKKNISDVVSYIYKRFSLNHKLMKDQAKNGNYKFVFNDKEYGFICNINLDLEYLAQIELKLIRKHCRKHGHYKTGDINLRVLIPEKQHKIKINKKSKLYKKCRAKLLTQNTLNDYIYPDNWKNIYLARVKKLVIINSSGKNNDTRGTKKCDIYYTFRNKIILDNGKISFYDFVVALHMIKSHKFDNWFELFSGIKKFKHSGKKLSITIAFNHGL